MNIKFSCWAWSTEPKWRAESELKKLSDVISQYHFSGKNNDEWCWNFSPNKLYSATSLVNILTEIEVSLSPVPSPTETNELIPQKFGIFIWRANQNRLPVRTELDARGIDLHSTRCPVYDDDIKTLQHCLINCNKATEIWNRIRSWWNLDHLYIANLSDLSKAKIDVSKRQGFRHLAGYSLDRKLLYLEKSK
ncbi:uncharacterized protein [Rutidosis leptorrhynchoides]|uniref:uncharacterized protein n=1 Tax=Rutidosis leptorrhynchoides TaxID=125765 RepID=UPI003A9A06BD